MNKFIPRLNSGGELRLLIAKRFFWLKKSKNIKFILDGKELTLLDIIDLLKEYDGVN